ncbi:MAG: archease [Chromatiales bacterium]
MWTHFQHDADVGISGAGASPAAAFQQAAVALTAVITEPERVRCQQSVEIHCSAPDLELLFVDWLNELIYEMATRRMLFSKFDVHIDSDQLQATACGEVLDVQRHQPACEIKGATYTELAVHQLTDGSWQARCVVDV